MHAKHVAAILYVALVAGCDGWGTDLEVACTSDPCPQGLEVVVLDAPADGYSLELVVVSFDGDESIEFAPWVQRCEAGATCDRVGLFPYFSPPRLRLTYRSADTTIVREVEPEYRVRERSEECGRDCFYGMIELRVRGG